MRDIITILKYREDMTKIIEQESLYFLPLVPLTVVLGLTVYGYYERVISAQEARVLISALGVLATVSLVSATVTTLKQNRKTIEDIERDRLKPLYKGMVRKIVIPTRSNVAGAERCLKMERILGSAYGGNYFNEITPPEINPILWNRFESEYKTTANLMEEVDDQINTICDLASELVKDIEATFLEEVEDPEIDPEHLAKKVVCPDNSVRWDNHTENYWNQEREQLIRLALETHFECFYELRHQEYLLSKKFTKLDNQLVDIEDQLREEYGIPFQDIEQPF